MLMATPKRTEVNLEVLIQKFRESIIEIWKKLVATTDEDPELFPKFPVSELYFNDKLNCT